MKNKENIYSDTEKYRGELNVRIMLLASKRRDFDLNKSTSKDYKFISYSEKKNLRVDQYGVSEFFSFPVLHKDIHFLGFESYALVELEPVSLEGQNVEKTTFIVKFFLGNRNSVSYIARETVDFKEWFEDDNFVKRKISAIKTKGHALKDRGSTLKESFKIYYKDESYLIERVHKGAKDNFSRLSVESMIGRLDKKFKDKKFRYSPFSMIESLGKDNQKFKSLTYEKSWNGFVAIKEMILSGQMKTDMRSVMDSNFLEVGAESGKIVFGRAIARKSYDEIERVSNNELRRRGTEVNLNNYPLDNLTLVIKDIIIRDCLFVEELNKSDSSQRPFLICGKKKTETITESWYMIGGPSPLVNAGISADKEHHTTSRIFNIRNDSLYYSLFLEAENTNLKESSKIEIEEQGSSPFWERNKKLQAKEIETYSNIVNHGGYLNYNISRTYFKEDSWLSLERINSEKNKNKNKNKNKKERFYHFVEAGLL